MDELRQEPYPRLLAPHASRDTALSEQSVLIGSVLLCIGGKADTELVCLSGVVVPSCLPSKETTTAIYCTSAMGIVYFAVTCYILLYKLREFRKLPYAEVQVAVVFYRLQVWHNTSVEQDHLSVFCPFCLSR